MRRVVGHWLPGKSAVPQLFPRVGFIVTNLEIDSRSSQDHRMAVGLILNEIWKYKMEVPGKMDAG